MKEILGIDVGATGIKGALVDLKKGQLISERIKYKTPKPSTQKAILEVIEKIIESDRLGNQVDISNNTWK